MWTGFQMLRWLLSEWRYRVTAHKKLLLPRTLQQAYAKGLRAVLGGGAVSCARGSPVGHTQLFDF